MADEGIIASDPNFGNVSVCPGGIVHVNLTHLSLKFMPSDFERFAGLIADAQENLQERAPKSSGKPSLRIVSPEDEDKDDSPCDSCDGDD